MRIMVRMGWQACLEWASDGGLVPGAQVHSSVAQSCGHNSSWVVSPTEMKKGA